MIMLLNVFAVKTDALSRNEDASPSQPTSDFDDKIYALFVNHDNFHTQLKDEQPKDLLIRDALQHIRDNTKIPKGRLKRVQ